MCKWQRERVKARTDVEGPLAVEQACEHLSIFSGMVAPLEHEAATNAWVMKGDGMPSVCPSAIQCASVHLLDCSTDSGAHQSCTTAALGMVANSLATLQPIHPRQE